MARSTKEEAQATRQRLLDSAECLFQQQGIVRTSLDDVARHAGVTRGAVYWHFAGKAELFEALMARATLPMEQALGTFDGQPHADPLADLRRRTDDALAAVVGDEHTRRMFDIAIRQAQHLGELGGVCQRRQQVRGAVLATFAHLFEQARTQGQVAADLPAVTAAHGLHALVEGLIHAWLSEPDAFDLAATGRFAIDAYLRGLAPR